jgi:hypothetical protein
MYVYRNVEAPSRIIVSVEKKKVSLISMFVRACLRVRARALVGVGTQACTCTRAALIIQHATRCHIVICGLSGSTIFFDITSEIARFSGGGGGNVFNQMCVLIFSTNFI